MSLRFFFRKDDALLCLEKMLKLHLDSVNVELSRNYPDDHPMTDLVNDFGYIVYDFDSLEDAPMANVKLLWSATRRILDWIQRQKSKVMPFFDGYLSIGTTLIMNFEHLLFQTTGTSNSQSINFDDMLVRANNQIYRQILQIEPCGRGQETITLCKPFAIAASPRRSMTGSGSTTPDPAAGDSGVSEADDGAGLQQQQHMGSSPKRRISGTLLALHGVRFSLLAFLTSANDAGPLYIPAQEYHTQFAEICLDRCDPLVSDNMWVAFTSLISLTCHGKERLIPFLLQNWRLADLGVVYGMEIPSRACASKRKTDGEAVYVASWTVACGGEACGR